MIPMHSGNFPVILLHCSDSAFDLRFTNEYTTRCLISNFLQHTVWELNVSKPVRPQIQYINCNCVQQEVNLARGWRELLPKVNCPKYLRLKFGYYEHPK